MKDDVRAPKSDCARVSSCSRAAELKRRVPELLAPAGGMEQLRAAVRFGADAVYLAADRFGMRARATNFRMDELPEAVAIAHEAGVKVYVACNVVMNDQDMDQLPAFYADVERAGADALIVSDLGALTLARGLVPSIELHVSTQASISNTAAALACYKLGARRIVCARELSLEQIRVMRDRLPEDLQLEAFVHGAMCMAVSGRCLISSYLTGRSGNKGACTQPCRWQYTLEEEKRPGEHFPIDEDDRGTFIMNSKDMNLLGYIDELVDAGIDSLKIEGRNKKAFYVATVVNAYRRVLNGEDPCEVMAELDTVSHRPYSTGFYFGSAQQADHYDGYEQTCLHAADVIACAQMEDASFVSCQFAGVSAQSASPVCGDDQLADVASAWLIECVCRNRFAEGDVLEVLRPIGRPVELTVRNLVWLPDEEDLSGEALAATRAEAIAVPVANRSRARYRFYAQCAEAPCESGDYLRVRQFHRSSRSEAKAAAESVE